MDIQDSRIVQAWALTVTAAWAVTIGMGTASFGVTEVMAVWTVLMAIPVLMTVKKYMEDDSNKLFNFWAAVTVLLMIENFLVPSQLAFYSYFHLWIAAGAAGFYYTSTKLPPPSESTYRYGAAASALGLAVAVYQPLLAPVIALVVQGGPVLYDWYTVHR